LKNFRGKVKIVTLGGEIVTIVYATSSSFSIIEQILAVSGVIKSNTYFLKSSNLEASTPPLKKNHFCGSFLLYGANNYALLTLSALF